MGDTKKDTSQGIVTTGAAIARDPPHCLLHSEMLRLELTVDLIGEVIFVNRGVDRIVEAMREVRRASAIAPHEEAPWIRAGDTRGCRDA
jgi:hypothetical protein